MYNLPIAHTRPNPAEYKQVASIGGYEGIKAFGECRIRTSSICSKITYIFKKHENATISYKLENAGVYEIFAKIGSDELLGYYKGENNDDEFLKELSK